MLVQLAEDVSIINSACELNKVSYLESVRDIIHSNYCYYETMLRMFAPT